MIKTKTLSAEAIAHKIVGHSAIAARLFVALRYSVDMTDEQCDKVMLAGLNAMTEAANKLFGPTGQRE